MAKIKGVLDPGHGGKACYNVGYSGQYYEHVFALEFDKRLQKKLEATGYFDILLTRDTDIFLELWERAEIAKNFGADFFFSTHTNAGGTTARGSECYYSVDLPNDKKFAARVSAEIAFTFGVPDRGAKIKTQAGKWDGINEVEDYFGVIDGSQDRGIPHVWLAELLFHSNPYDEQILLTKIDVLVDIVFRNICIEFNVPSEEEKIVERDLVKKIIKLESDVFCYVEVITDKNDPTYKRTIWHDTKDTYFSLKEENGVGTFEVYALGKGGKVIW
jgi:hypothetical protein